MNGTHNHNVGLYIHKLNTQYSTARPLSTGFCNNEKGVACLCCAKHTYQLLVIHSTKTMGGIFECFFRKISNQVAADWATSHPRMAHPQGTLQWHTTLLDHHCTGHMFCKTYVPQPQLTRTICIAPCGATELQ